MALILFHGLPTRIAFQLLDVQLKRLYDVRELCKSIKWYKTFLKKYRYIKRVDVFLNSLLMLISEGLWNNNIDFTISSRQQQLK